MEINPQQSVGDLLVERPDLIPLFERLGIDYCCGGRRSLQEACAQINLDAASVAQTIDAFVSLRDENHTSAPDWSQESLTALCDHIEQSHHLYLTEELPVLGALVEKVTMVHGDRHPSLYQVKEVFDALRHELLDHLYKEETVLFPLIRRLESRMQSRIQSRSESTMPVAGLIQQMESEHSESGDALTALRDLTDDFTPPADACGSYRAMLTGLERLEKDMHLHVHKENNIVFPRAIAMEEA